MCDEASRRLRRWRCVGQYVWVCVWVCARISHQWVQYKQSVEPARILYLRACQYMQRSPSRPIDSPSRHLLLHYIEHSSRTHTHARAVTSSFARTLTRKQSHIIYILLYFMAWVRCGMGPRYGAHVRAVCVLWWKRNIFHLGCGWWTVKLDVVERRVVPASVGQIEIIKMCSRESDSWLERRQKSAIIYRRQQTTSATGAQRAKSSKGNSTNNRGWSRKEFIYYNMFGVYSIWVSKVVYFFNNKLCINSF